jgi:serine/threonine-protein kinase
LVVGRPPFQSERPLDVILQVQEADPPTVRSQNPRAPRAIDAICLRCLEKKPAERYRSAAALAEDLERFLKDEEVDAAAVGWTTVVRRWARRSPAIAYRLLGIGLFAAFAQANYMATWPAVPPDHHYATLGLLSATAAAAIVFQQLLRRGIWTRSVPTAWSLTEIVLATWLLATMRGQSGPLLAAYPLLIVVSGLWGRCGLVLWTTGGTIVAFGVLSQLRAAELPFNLFSIQFVVALLLVGALVRHQVRRLTTLQQFYERPTAVQAGKSASVPITF